MTHLLDIEKLTRHFGGLAAVSDLTFHVDENEILGIIGPNGAGKTTAINLVSGVIRPFSSASLTNSGGGMGPNSG